VDDWIGLGETDCSGIILGAVEGVDDIPVSVTVGADVGCDSPCRGALLFIMKETVLLSYAKTASLGRYSAYTVILCLP
jgi:hypothetical protein